LKEKEKEDIMCVCVCVYYLLDEITSAVSILDKTPELPENNNEIHNNSNNNSALKTDSSLGK